MGNRVCCNVFLSVNVAFEWSDKVRADCFCHCIGFCKCCPSPQPHLKECRLSAVGFSRYVIVQVAKLLDAQYERINFSANTSIEQLYGSYVPTFVGGQRVFSWQDGKLVQAIRAKKWLLLDEVNLAPADVLDRVAALLDPSISRFMVLSTGSAALRDPGSSKFVVPGSEEVLDISDLHVFATMNPAVTGGGRTRLPQSISCLFMMVRLDEYASYELQQICRALFAKPMADGLVTESQVSSIFKLHEAVLQKIKAREIGRLGGPYEFNLRDLAKVKDVLQACMHDHVLHYGFLPEQRDQSQQVSQSSIAILAIRQYLQLVYGQRFQEAADQKAVSQLIEELFPQPVTVAAPFSIDSSVSKYVRIGSVYMSKHGEVSCAKPAVHTPETIRQLELLAVASQSGRAVLLEGDTCSRKTLLVQELARLTESKLLTLSLNQDTETATLIGQWLPMQVSRHSLHCRVNV